MESTTTRFGGTMHITLDSSAPGKTQPIARSIFHKTRLLGRSHWCVNGILMVGDSSSLHVISAKYLTGNRFAIYSNR